MKKDGYFTFYVRYEGKTLEGYIGFGWFALLITSVLLYKFLA